MQVRLSALHAVKRLVRLRPAVLAANSGANAALLLPGIAAAAVAKQNTLLQVFFILLLSLISYN